MSVKIEQEEKALVIQVASKPTHTRKRHKNTPTSFRIVVPEVELSEIQSLTMLVEQQNKVIQELKQKVFVLEKEVSVYTGYIWVERRLNRSTNWMHFLSIWHRYSTWQIQIDSRVGQPSCVNNHSTKVTTKSMDFCCFCEGANNRSLLSQDYHLAEVCHKVDLLEGYQRKRWTHRKRKLSLWTTRSSGIAILLPSTYDLYSSWLESRWRSGSETSKSPVLSDYRSWPMCYGTVEDSVNNPCYEFSSVHPLNRSFFVTTVGNVNYRKWYIQILSKILSLEWIPKKSVVLQVVDEGAWLYVIMRNEL